MLNFLLIKEINRSKEFEERYKATDDDHRFGITASKLVEKALKKTMDPKQLEKLIRYKEDSLAQDEMLAPYHTLGEDEVWGSNGTDPWHKKDQIDLKASGLAPKERPRTGTGQKQGRHL